MSILTERLPDSVSYKGKSYKVETDFRAWLEFYSGGGDIVRALKVYRELPPSIEAAVRLAAEFGSKGALKYKTEKGNEQIIDYELDAELIYAAFLGEYGIDLCEESLHWYKFCALLGGLGEERLISKIMAVRATKPDEETDPKRKKELKRLRRIYACPDRRSLIQKDSDAVRELEKFY